MTWLCGDRKIVCDSREAFLVIRAKYFRDFRVLKWVLQ